ncbi:MAG TPA: Gfo/Idh/MocA family oxidoreductase [Solirubrobacteraceae bacterium]|nr:Gfo/Idh/MocA family oxidoreductase [Solirubrobacteraceae bacterium]
MLRAAIIGCGAIGVGTGETAHADLGVSTHAAAYAACPDTRLVSVADADPRRAAHAAERWPGTAAPPGVAELLHDTAPELVSLCTPDPTHTDLLETILTAPGVRGVLAEKPLADDPGRASELTRLAQERGVILAVNYSRRYAPPLLAVAESIRAGELGELQHIHGVYGKGLRHNGTHWLDLLRMVAGDAVAATGWDRLEESGADPSLDAELDLPGGAGARLAALDADSFTAFEMEIVGTAGRVRLADAAQRIERWIVTGDDRYPGHRRLVLDRVAEAATRDVMLHAVADLARCVRDGGRPACTGEDATRALAIAEAIATSAAAGGRPVPIEPLPIMGT